MSVSETGGLYLSGTDAPQLLVLCGEAYNIIKAGIGAVSDDPAIKDWLAEFENFVESRIVDKPIKDVTPLTPEEYDKLKANAAIDILKVRMENQ